MADDWKPERVSSSSLIPINGSNFYNMRGVQDLQSLEGSAPAFHRRMLEALKASGKVRDDGTHQEVESIPSHASAPRRRKGIGNGARVMDLKRGIKVTIIHANAGHTKKSKTPVHRVANRDGETWFLREDEMKLIL